jgi:hypothetical protein
MFRFGLKTVVVFAFVHASSLSESTLAKDQLRIGERMYREDDLPRKVTMRAFIAGDAAVDGRILTCATVSMLEAENAAV